jgi:Tfp pilus assembly protein PilO
VHNKEKKISPVVSSALRIGFYRWELITAVFCAGVAGIIYYALTPAVINQWKQYRTISQSLTWKRQITSASEQIATYTHQSAKLDSIIRKINQFLPYIESGVLQTIYSSADSSHLFLTKVEIGKPIRATDKKEIPIAIEGSGTYGGLARFISDLENSRYIVRIRQLSIKHIQQDSGKVLCDASIIDTISTIPDNFPKSAPIKN